jgi:hypothetical protein
MDALLLVCAVAPPVIAKEEYCSVLKGKNYGKRWWRLGSGVGIIAVLTCRPAEAVYMYVMTPKLINWMLTLYQRQLL